MHPRQGNTTIRFDLFDAELTPTQEEIIARATRRFDAKMEEAARDLKAQYEYLQTDEAIAETLRINEYYFNDAGEIDD